MSKKELKVHRMGTNTATYLENHMDRWKNINIKENVIFRVSHEGKNGKKSAYLEIKDHLKIELFKDSKNKWPPKMSQEFNLLEDFGIIQKQNSDYSLIAKTKPAIINQIVKSLKRYLESITLNNINLNSLILTILYDRYNGERWFNQIEKIFREGSGGSPVFKGGGKFYSYWLEPWNWIKGSITTEGVNEIYDLISKGIGLDTLTRILSTIAELKDEPVKKDSIIKQAISGDNSIFSFIKDTFLASNKSINIPPFQREYVWAESILKILIEDVVHLLDNKNKIEEIFLGTFVFGEGDKKLELLDGQQRLVTILMILSMARLICKKNKVPIPSEVAALFEEVKKGKLTGSSQLEKIIKPLLLLESDIDFDKYSITNAPVKSFGISYKELNELDWSSNYKDYWKKLLLNINILTYTHNQGNYVDIFVKLNTTSQELSFLSLLKSYLMVKVGGSMEASKKTDYYKDIDKKLRESYFYMSFEDGKKIPEFLKFVHDYLSISQNKTEKLKESCSNKSQSIVFSFFKEKILDDILEHEEIRPNIGTESINKNEVKKIIDFLSLMTEYYKLLINQGHKDNELKKRDFIWIMDFITLFKKVKNFHPLIVHIMQKGYDHNNKKKINYAREILWNLERLYVSRFKTGSSYTAILNRIGEGLKDWSDFNELNKKLVQMVDEGPSKGRLNFLSDEHVFAGGNDFRIHLFHRLELAKRIKSKTPSYEIKKINFSNKEVKELMDFYLNPSIKIELEHIVPKKFKQGLMINKHREIFEEGINTLGNLCLLKKEINNEMKNETYKNKQKIFKKHKRKDFFFSIEDVTIASGTKVEGAYKMRVDSSDLIPKLTSWRKRNTNITKTLKTIYGIS